MCDRAEAGDLSAPLEHSAAGPPSLTFTLQETRVWFGGRLVMLNGQPVTPGRPGSLSAKQGDGATEVLTLDKSPGIDETGRDAPLRH